MLIFLIGLTDELSVCILYCVCVTAVSVYSIHVDVSVLCLVLASMRGLKAIMEYFDFTR